MQVQVRTGRLLWVVEVPSDATPKQIFEQLAKIDQGREIFGRNECGVCKNEKDLGTRFNVRTAIHSKTKKEITYYEMICNDHFCGAKFSFGQNADQKGLFPKYTNGLTGEEKKYLPNGGWSKQFAYKPQEDESE